MATIFSNVSVEIKVNRHSKCDQSEKFVLSFGLYVRVVNPGNRSSVLFFSNLIPQRPHLFQGVGKWIWANNGDVYGFSKVYVKEKLFKEPLCCNLFSITDHIEAVKYQNKDGMVSILDYGNWIGILFVVA